MLLYSFYNYLFISLSLSIPRYTNFIIYFLLCNHGLLRYLWTWPWGRTKPTTASLRCTFLLLLLLLQSHITWLSVRESCCFCLSLPPKSASTTLLFLLPLVDKLPWERRDIPAAFARGLFAALARATSSGNATAALRITTACCLSGWWCSPW